MRVSFLFRASLAALVVSIFVAGCFRPTLDRELKLAKELREQAEYKDVVATCEKLLIRAPDNRAAVEAATIAGDVSLIHLKNYVQAIRFYKHVVTYSRKSAERIKYQAKIIELLFGRLNDYKLAIIEINRMLELPLPIKEEFVYRMLLAKSYFYVNNLFQSVVETDHLLKKKLDRDQTFEARYFKANVLLAYKKAEEALVLFESLEKEFPKLSRKEKVQMQIAVAYEDVNNYEKAIETLTKLKSTYSDRQFLELKIDQLKRRRKNLPGYRGLRK